MYNSTHHSFIAAKMPMDHRADRVRFCGGGLKKDVPKYPPRCFFTKTDAILGV